MTDHIIDLSDLVLVFFDARHPEPGAMQDTLTHLVADTIQRSDSEKFLYILNQIDTAAQEDNPEAVVASWQRALAAKGLTAGRFYTIYNEEVAVPIEDESVRQRFAAKRDADLAEIVQRLHQVEVERSYRIIGSLDTIANSIENETIPMLKGLLARWRNMVLVGDLVALAVLALLFAGVNSVVDITRLFSWDFTTAAETSILKLVFLGLLLAITHLTVRKLTAKWIARKLDDNAAVGHVRKAFMKSTWLLRPMMMKQPSGWGSRSRALLHSVRTEAGALVQTLNDRFTNPSGEHDAPKETAEILSVVESENEAEEEPKTAT